MQIPPGWEGKLVQLVTFSEAVSELLGKITSSSSITALEVLTVNKRQRPICSKKQDNFPCISLDLLTYFYASLGHTDDENVDMLSTLHHEHIKPYA